MYRTTSLISVLAFLILATTTHAEKVPLSPKELRDTSTHIVKGKVTAIYQRITTSGNWKYTHFVAELQVKDCEKGTGIKKGGIVYVRYWQRRWIGQDRMPPDTIGHRGLPTEGESLRVYLACNAYDGFGTENKDGGYNVIGANGFESLKETTKK